MKCYILEGNMKLDFPQGPEFKKIQEYRITEFNVYQIQEYAKEWME